MTKRTPYGLFLALLAWAVSPALSQSITLPPQTVYGRLGIGAGPGQAIPFATLNSNLLTPRVNVADANYGVANGDTEVAYTSITAARTVSLQSAGNYIRGQTVCIRDVSGSASGATTISAIPAGSDTINGVSATTAVVTLAYGSACLESSGSSAWTIVARPNNYKTIDDFGASPSNSAAANLTAIQAAFDATPAGGTIGIIQRGYNVAGLLVIKKNIKVLCANADPTVNPNITQTTTTATTLAIRSGYVMVEGCSFGLAGTPAGAATGITIGDDAIQVVNGGAFTNTSATLTCASCTFTTADVGKGIWASNVGPAGAPLFTKISAFIDATHVTMANAAGGTQATQTFAYGFDYQEVVIKDTQVYNYVRGVDIVSATQYHLDHVFSLGKFPLRVQNTLWGDSGDGEISRGTWFSNDNAAGIAVQYQSGGILRFIGNKVLGGLDCIQINWNYTTSIGPLVVGNSIEGGCTHGINVSNSVPLLGGTFTNNEIGVSGSAVLVSSPTTWANWTMSGNHISTGAGNTAFSIANSSNCTLANNTIGTDGAASAAYSIASTAANCVLRPGATTAAAAITNLSTTTLIDDQRGMAFANLPTAASNGSRIFVTDGAPASSPCTGTSTGSTAFRQNGAWKCF